MNQLTEPRRIRTVDELLLETRRVIMMMMTDYLSKWELAEEDEEEQDEKWDNDPSSKEKWDNETAEQDDQE
ncbi:hypothetical protein OS493_037517 [Desmophyllum pertusum]|uniref:Uncharacterized protein n=1 Tax=Desmophyllum pertusum TaxID=174260 RepID=A0A9W9ZYR0_9CNID|nr:hypothetical protein OS493_037517 [Desmophyllum pertusum]